MAAPLKIKYIWEEVEGVKMNDKLGEIWMSIQYPLMHSVDREYHVELI